MPDYLHECLKRHGEIARALFGQRQDLRAIERCVAHVICKGRLTFTDVETIRSAQFWQGGTFWQWPTRQEFEDRCENDAIEELQNLRKRQKPIVKRLLRVFRHIEPVSVVLRFIDPNNFGIMSAPVEKILEIGPAHRPRAKYLKYVTDLRDLRRKRHFSTVADVDMALWAMSEVIEAVRSGSEWLRDVVPESEQWIDAFWADETIREIRVANLTSSLFDTMELAQLAKALMPSGEREITCKQVRLAGRIAAIEFELAVMKVFRQQGNVRGHDEGLGQAVQAIRISRERRARWNSSVRIRNRAVHGDHFTRDDVEELICTMRDAVDYARRPGN